MHHPAFDSRRAYVEAGAFSRDHIRGSEDDDDRHHDGCGIVMRDHAGADNNSSERNEGARDPRRKPIVSHALASLPQSAGAYNPHWQLTELEAS